MTHEIAQVGPRLRALRKTRGWTLDRLASRAGVSASTLSRLESGKHRATLELLLPLTRALGVRLDDLVPQETPDPRVNRPVMRRDGVVFAPLTPESAPVHTYKVTFPPTPKPPRMRGHEGHEWLYVLSGRLRLQLGERDLVLRRGEAADFDTMIPHALSAAGDQPAEIISIFGDDGILTHTAEDSDG